MSPTWTLGSKYLDNSTNFWTTYFSLSISFSPITVNILKKAGQAMSDYNETFIKQLIFELAKPLLTLSNWVMLKLTSLVSLRLMSLLFKYLLYCSTGAYTILTGFLFLSILPFSYHRLSRLFRSKSFGGTIWFFFLGFSTFFSSSSGFFSSFWFSESYCSG